MTPETFTLCIIHRYTPMNVSTPLLQDTCQQRSEWKAQESISSESRRLQEKKLALSAVVLHFIWKCGWSVETLSPWRQTLPCFERSHRVFNVIFQRLKNKGQSSKRREFTSREGPSLGAYLSFELLTDALSVLLDEIMKSLFILIHIKILI